MAFGFDPKRPRSLRGQLVGLVAALAVPLIALEVWWGYGESRRAGEEAGAEALALADATAMTVRLFLTQAEASMIATAGEVGEALVTQPPCDDAMRRVVTIFTFLTNLTTVDRDGSVLCSSLKTFPTETSAASWSWFPAMKEDPHYVLGNPMLGEMSGEWILPLIAPITDAQGRFIGALAGSVSLLEFDRILRGDERQDEDVLVTIATREGFVITRSRDAEEWVGRQSPPGRVAYQSLGPGRGVARGPDLEDVDRSWGQVELENGWWVSVGLSADAVFGSAEAAAARRINTTILMLIVVMLIAGRSYRRIGSALKELASGIPMTPEGEGVPLPEGTPTEVRAVVDQFNETLRSRNRAEAAERATRQRYESIFHNAVFGLYVTVDGGFVEVNASLVAMLGYESAQALIDAGPEALYTTPGIRADLIERALEAGVIEDWEVDWVCADDRQISVRLNGKFIQTTEGERALEVIVQDITDEKRKDDELRQTQKMEAIGKLAGGIAHDFNNLLTVIAGNANFIEDGIPADHPLRAEVDEIIEATERATGLTAQLLAFSRKEPWGVRRVDLNEVLTNMEKMLIRLIGEDVTLETRLTTDPALVLIDRGELEQIIMNLVLNARDAMPGGGGVTVATRSAPLAPKGLATGDGVLLSVSDSGLGMDPETRKRMFEPFYTTKPMGEGTGLGLSTVYGIVQRAEGHIDVESEPGQGTTIDIWFPHAPEQADPEQHAEGPAERPARRAVGNERILVVEDEDLVRMFVRRVLENVGYEVLIACDGVEALEIVEGLNEPADLVVTDVVMPNMKGPELVERLSTISPDTAVLYMSGYIDNKTVSEQLADHADAILQKPFSIDELREQVRFLLDERYAPDGTPTSPLGRDSIKV